jgi:acetyltransferase-like isoleucine patch superfamily enzyme
MEPPVIGVVHKLGRSGGRTTVSAYRSWIRVRDKLFSVLVSSAFAEFGRRSVLQLPIRLSGEGRIAIGSDVFVGAGSWLQVLDEAVEEVALTIGDGTSIAGNCVISAEQSVRLGRKVLLARNVYIADHMHAFDDPTRAVLEQGTTRVGPVEIGDGAWLGQNVVVGPGVRIGRGAVIGANSVVLADVPDHDVAVGAPARVLARAREAPGLAPGR